MLRILIATVILSLAAIMPVQAADSRKELQDRIEVLEGIFDCMLFAGPVVQIKNGCVLRLQLSGDTNDVLRVKDAITKNATDVGNIDTSGIAKNATAIAAIDTSGIATNATAITANATAIGNIDTSGIAKNATAIGKNATAIAAIDTSGIATNKTAIDAINDDIACISTDSDDENLHFVGCNVYVQSGSGTTQGDVNGLGNLIVGYNEKNERNGPIEFCSIAISYYEPYDKKRCKKIGGTWGINQRTGSHNIIVGHGNSYTSYGGFVGGQYNSVGAPSASVYGGHWNISAYYNSTILGGQNNLARGESSTVGGGSRNEAKGMMSTVSGGRQNLASGYSSTISGGSRGVSSGDGSHIGGGRYNTSSGKYTTVSGGRDVTVDSEADYGPAR